MSRMELLGPIIKQAREEKGWTQQELAERLEISVEDVEKHEKGESDLDTLTVAKYIFLPNISPDVTIYEDDVEDALRMDRMYRELQALSQPQFDRLTESAAHIRRWRESHPDTVTLDDYWNTFKEA